ncbi:MAG: hypothetical protein R6X02_02370 [Enhygromyxa sp.]
MAPARRLLMIALASALGCNAESAEGERVNLTTEVVAQVCRGTLEQLDAEIERVESELGFRPLSERVELHVLDAEDIEAHCGRDPVCVEQPPRRLYIRADAYDQLIRLELARDRVARTTAGRTKPLFFEGLAGALSWPSCEPIAPFWNDPTTTKLLEAQSRRTLGDEGRYLGGELMRWLLDTRGPEPVLAFMRDVGRYEHPDLVRLAYIEHFASVIDSDLFTHWRPSDQPVDPGQRGCVAPELPHGERPSILPLRGELDCGSAQVRNDFRDPSRGFIEWTLTITEARDGQYRLRGPLPEGVEVTIESCACIPERWSSWFSEPPTAWPANSWRWLDAGAWRLRVYGPLGASFELEVQAPCSFVEQDCGPGRQCSHQKQCVDEVPDPGQLGDPCEVPLDSKAPRTCAGGLACVGPRGSEGLCMQHCTAGACEEGLVCGGADSLCSEPCDPIGQDCPAGYGCMPGPGGNHGCLPVGEAGSLEVCRVGDLDCAPGLSCTFAAEVEGCSGFIEGVGPTGCCAAICEVSAAEPGCPPELPNCVADEDQTLGTCGP